MHQDISKNNNKEGYLKMSTLKRKKAEKSVGSSS
jgi:hypothetical protein